jgi:sarcosine oxidase subunit beta
VQADVVVVGGGCVGASTAFYLARRRAGRVLLVERDRVAGGPTARTVGIVRLHYSHEPLVELARRSLDRFASFQDLTGRTADFTRAGFLLLAPAAELEGLAANVELQRRLGVRAEVLKPEEVARLDPRIDLEGVAGAAYEPDAGYADGYATATGFAAAARESGVEVWEGAEAQAVEVSRGRVTGVRTSRGLVASPPRAGGRGGLERRVVAAPGGRFPGGGVQGAGGTAGPAGSLGPAGADRGGLGACPRNPRRAGIRARLCE